LRIARVFPVKTSMSPVDPDAYYGGPELFMPKYDAVHVSCQFTWDMPKAKRLVIDWEHIAPVKLGGVAIDGESDRPFVAGMYLRKGVTITSRGYVNNCSFCTVRRGLIEFDDFPEGNVVQDNNILACSVRHWRLVMSMLKKQKAIEFKGGLDKNRITSKIVEDLQGLRIKEIWLACDQPQGIRSLNKAMNLLKRAGFTRRHIHCYVLVGDNPKENVHRLREVYRMGAMPFAQLYRAPKDTIEYSRSWKRLATRWSRPAAIEARTKSIKEVSEWQKKSRLLRSWLKKVLRLLRKRLKGSG